jgi:hypothetical protein
VEKQHQFSFSFSSSSSSKTFCCTCNKRFSFHREQRWNSNLSLVSRPHEFLGTCHGLESR